MILKDMYLLIFSGACTIMLCLMGPRFAPVLGLIDIPGGRKVHARPTPLLGGLALVLIFAPSVLLLAAINESETQPILLSIAACTMGMAALGIIDDRHLIHPNKRLAISAVVFAIATLKLSPISIGLINWNGHSDGIHLGVMAPLVTTVALVAFVNAVNLADGKNGLVLGIGLGWLIILAISAPPEMFAIIAILSIIVSILFIFNMIGLLFLGDGGSYGLASVIGLLSIYVYQHSEVMRSADQVGLMFMIPVGDMIRLMVTRIRAGRSAFSPDRDHLHHLLLDRFGWAKGLVSYWSLVLVPAAISLAWPKATITVICITFALYWIVVGVAHRRSRD